MSTFVRLLGPPAIRHEGVWLEPPFGKAMALLYYLAFTQEWVGRDQLVYLFWPDSSQEHARGNLRKLLSRDIRKRPFTDEVEVEPTRLRWRVDCDVEEFRNAASSHRWAEAVDLFRGELLQGVRADSTPEFEAWIEMERVEWNRDRREAVFRQADALEVEGRHSEAAELLEPLTRVDMLDEEPLRRQLQNYQLAGQTSRALGAFKDFRQRLDDEFGGEPEAATLGLIEEIGRGDATQVIAAPPLVTAPAVPRSRPRHDLPVQPTRFIGREAERAALAERLEDPDCRLVTLVAVGGMGKTRLALALAASLESRFADGVCFVPFDAVSSPEGMVYALSEALELRLLGNREPREQLLDHLRDRELLLVLDNLEHLLDGAGLIAELLTAAPGLKVVATSREALSLRGEWLYEIEGMGFPSRELAAGSTELDIDAYGCLALFRQTARQLGITLEPGDYAAVARICERVGGLPLGVELAASWTQLVSVEEIVQELEADLDFLSSSRRDVTERHASMRAVFDTSWRRLSSGQQRTLAALSVFRGGFDRSAAVLVAGASLRELLQLASKSLIRRQDTGRFDLHPIIQHYAAEKLALGEVQADTGGGEQLQVAEAHGLYFLGFLHDRNREFREGEAKGTLQAIDVEWANVQAALSWAVLQGRLTELLKGATYLEEFFIQTDRYFEGIEVLDEAIAGLDRTSTAHHPPLGLFLMIQAWLYFHLGRFEASERVAAEAVSLLEPLGPSVGLMQALNALGAIEGRSGRLENARTYFTRALAMARECDEHFYGSFHMHNLALVERDLGNHSEAEQLHREALAAGRGRGDPISIAMNLSSLGMLLVLVDRLDEAGPLLEQGLAIAREMGFGQLEPIVVRNLGHLAFKREDYPAARARYLEALELVGESESKFGTPELLARLGRIAMVQGDDQSACEFFREAVETARAFGSVGDVLSSLVAVTELWIRQGRVGPAIEVLERVAGHQASIRSLRDRATRLLEPLRSSPIDAPEAELQEGAGRTIEEIVAEALRALSTSVES